MLNRLSNLGVWVLNFDTFNLDLGYLGIRAYESREFGELELRVSI